MEHSNILITNQGVIPPNTKVTAKELTPFHFSARYSGREKELIQEAMAAFRSDLR